VLVDTVIVDGLSANALPASGVAANACALAQAPSYPDRAELAIQVVVSAGMLDAASFGVFVLRRRVQRLLEATRALSTTDPLTGLRNRRHLVDQAPRVWRQARRDGTRVAAMVLDLDHFKRLNDQHGHAAGDAVLDAVARARGATVRPADVRARTGGEELVVIGLVGDDAEARHLAERLRTALQQDLARYLAARGAAEHISAASVSVRLHGSDCGPGAAGKWTEYVARRIMLRICDWVLSHRRLTASTQHNASALRGVA